MPPPQIVIYAPGALGKKKKRIPVDEPTRSLGSLGDVFRQAGFEQSEQADDSGEKETQTPVEPQTISLGKIVVRKEQKGRSGKTVTIIEGIELGEAGLKTLAKKMRKSLGCGAHIEDGNIVLQGDLVERARKWIGENEP